MSLFNMVPKDLFDTREEAEQGGKHAVMPVGLSDSVKFRRIVTPDDIRKEGRKVSDDEGIQIWKGGDCEVDPEHRGRTCSECLHSNRELAATAMHEQKFIERLLKDERYRSQWFTDFTQIGACEIFSDSSGIRLVFPNAPAICAASDLDSSLGLSTEEGKRQIPCPHFVDRRDQAKAIMHSSKSGVRGPSTRNREAMEYVRRHQANKPKYDYYTGYQRDQEDMQKHLERRRAGETDE